MLEIEIVETRQPEPLFALLEYLNDNIYSKMSKKDVEAIKSTCLQGELVKRIMEYTNIKVVNAVIDETQILLREKDNYYNIIQEMKDGKERAEEVYPSNGFTLKD